MNKTFISPMTGHTSDIRLYERTLSEDEINELYQMRSQRQARL